ncbi:alpha/beta hydrolase [Shewanella colwelliana]|nr:alpha/beta fold hydrolase [Shewanella colwelliana]
MKTIVISSTKHLIMALTYATLGILAALLIAAVWFLNSRTDLDIWHTIDLPHQFKHHGKVINFKQYLDAENRQFEALETQIYQATAKLPHQTLNRYFHGSYSDPNKWSQDWNRSFEWPLDDASFGVLLLHGMSDSPYALSHFANHYKGRAHVLGLRLPGHGTIPSGLVNLTWQDMAAAVALATEHLSQQLGDKPIYVVAFSTGAALALNHELAAINRGNQPAYHGLVFLSPAIGLPPVAAGAKWQDRLGQVLGLDKLSWNTIQTEYDPFKYNSFAVNAGDVVYQLAIENQRLLSLLTAKQLGRLGDILTFQSIVDDTVSTTAVLQGLYQRLPKKSHQLVLFDINRLKVNMALVERDPRQRIQPYLDSPLNQFELTVVENGLNQRDQSQVSAAVVANDFLGNALLRTTPINIAWPRGVYSLSHVALPYPEHDSLYGLQRNDVVERVRIGAAASRGERGVLGVSAAEMLRQKWNPFYPYMIERLDTFIDEAGPVSHR